MPTDASILIFGRDRLLLQTREWLLKAANYRVLAAETLLDVGKISGDQRVDLIVICHTVPEEDGEQALATVSTRCPNVKCLVLAAENKPDHAPCAETLPIMSSPQTFISKVQNLVGGKTPVLVTN
jgi:DNA-binding response OmpR family regulator